MQMITREELSDLLCSLHVRGKTPASKLSRTQLRESNGIEERILRLWQRLEKTLEAFE